MNEELLNQLLQKFQEVINNINDVLSGSIQKISYINSAIKGLANGDLSGLDINVDGIGDTSQITSKLRELLGLVKNVSTQLDDSFEPIVQLLNSITESATNVNSLTQTLSKVSSSLKQLGSININNQTQSEPEISDIGSGFEGNEPPISEEIIGEFPYEYIQPQSRISTVSLPYQDIANVIRDALSRPINKLDEIVNSTGLSFETIAGGLSKRQVEDIQSQTLPATLDSILLSLSRYSNRMYEKYSAIDRAVTTAFGKERLRENYGNLSKETVATLSEALGKAQFEDLKTGVTQFTNTLSNILVDLQHVQNVPVLTELPYNVGSPEFYKGFLGIPTISSIPSTQMGILLSDLGKAVNDALSVFARQLLPERTFERETINTLKGFGFSLFTSEPYQNVISTLKKELPEKYNEIQPYIEQTEQIKSIGEFNQTLTYLREALSSFGIKDLTQVEPIELTNITGNLNIDKINEFLKSINEFGNLSEEARTSANKIQEFLGQLKQVAETGNIPEGGLNVETFLEHVRVLSDELENQVNSYFKNILPEFVPKLSELRGDLLKTGASPETISSFTTMVESVNNIVQKLRQIEGNLTPLERVKLSLRESLEQPLSQMLHMNLVNMQWALMLGLSTSVMDVMTRPAYETVYTTISPIYETAGNLTGVLPLFNALHSFPQQVQQMTSMLQTSLNSISALLGSRFYADEAVRTAVGISRVQPIQLPEAIEVLTAISTYPSTRPYASSPEFQNQIFNVVQLLSLLAPEQGIRGALFALREALGGQWRSLQMRFNISPEVIAQYAGIPEERMKSATGEELIRYLYKGLTAMFGGERVLLQKGAQLDVQINNIVDTLISSLVLPLVSQQNSAIQKLVTEWYTSGIMQTFMPQQYDMLRKLAENAVLSELGVKSLRQLPEEDRKKAEQQIDVYAQQLAKDTWGTPIGAISGMVAIVNNALSDVIGSLGISDAITKIIVDFQRKFTSRVTEYKNAIGKLDFFDDKYTEKRRQIAERFIQGLLEDIGDSVRTVTGADLGIASAIMDVVRDAIMSVASKTTTFVLKESMLTAVNLPGNLFGTAMQSTAYGISKLFTTTDLSRTISNLGEGLSQLGKNVSGILSWVYMWKLTENISPVQTDWYKVTPGVLSILGTMNASAMFNGGDILSSILGLESLGVTFMQKEGLSMNRLLGATGLLMLTQVLEQLRRRSEGVTQYAIAGGESAIGGLMGSLLMIPDIGWVTAALIALGTGVLGVGSQWLENNYFARKETEKKTEDIIKQKIRTLSDTERATTQQLGVTWTTLGGADFYNQFKTQLDEFARIVARVQQGSNIFAVTATNQASRFLSESGIVSQQRLQEILPQLYNVFSETFAKLYESVKPLKPGEEPGTGLPGIQQIRTDLTKALERLIGKSIGDLPAGQRSVLTQFITQLSLSMFEQFKAFQVLKTGIAEVMQQIQPQIAWKQVQDFIYQKPVKLEPIKDVTDIQRYVQQVQRALADLVDTFRRLPTELNRLFGYMARGQVSYPEFSKITDTVYRKLLEVARSPKGADILASPHFYNSVMELMSWDKIALIRNPQLRQQVYETFFRRNRGVSFLDLITEKYWEHKLKVMEPGFEVLQSAYPVKDINLSQVFNQKIQQLAQQLDSAGNRLVSVLGNMSTNLSKVLEQLTGRTTVETGTKQKQVPEQKSLVGKVSSWIENTFDRTVSWITNIPKVFLPKRQNGSLLDIIASEMFPHNNNGILSVINDFLSPLNFIKTAFNILIPKPNIDQITSLITHQVSTVNKLPEQHNIGNITIITNNANMRGVAQVHISQ